MTHLPFTHLPTTTQKSLLDRHLARPTTTTPQQTSSLAQTPSSPLSTLHCKTLGLSLKTLLLHQSTKNAPTTTPSEQKNQSQDQRPDPANLLHLAKSTPALLLYSPGEERAKALVALWEIVVQDPTSPHNKNNNANNDNDNEKKAAPGTGAHPHVLVPYISPAVVPLIDYWPPAIRDAFARGVWRFVAIGNGEGDGRGKGGEGTIVFEIREYSLGVMEWLMEMEEREGEGERVRGGLGRLRI